LVGGHLATITSQAENEFIYKLICNNKEFWFIASNNYGYGPWVGGYKKEGSTDLKKGWEWVVGEEFKYSSWAPGVPDNYGGSEDRICFCRPNMWDKPLWNDVGKKVPLSGFIIEFDERAMTTPTKGEFCGVNCKFSHREEHILNFSRNSNLMSRLNLLYGNSR